MANQKDKVNRHVTDYSIGKSEKTEGRQGKEKVFSLKVIR